MLAMSIEDGALYQWFDPETGTGDTDAMLPLLKNFWHAVADVVPRRMGRVAAAIAAGPRRRDRRARLPDGRDQLRTARGGHPDHARRFEEHFASSQDVCHGRAASGTSRPMTSAAGTNSRTRRGTSAR